jgi:hypothetical protein
MKYSPDFILDSHATLLDFKALEDHVEKNEKINTKYVSRTMAEKFLYLLKRKKLK